MNAKMTVKGNKLVIEVDLTKDDGVAQSGKNVNVLKSGMFETIPGTNLKCNLLVIRPVGSDSIGNPVEVKAPAPASTETE